MKKIIIIALSLVLNTSLFSCESNDDFTSEIEDLELLATDGDGPILPPPPPKPKDPPTDP